MTFEQIKRNYEGVITAEQYKKIIGKNLSN